MLFKILEKIDPEKFAVNTFEQKIFIKITLSQKLNKVYKFYKNWSVVCTTSFHIRSNVIFSKKNVGPLNYCNLIYQISLDLDLNFEGLIWQLQLADPCFKT